MYLGKEILQDSKGTFIPIQWTGYVKSLNRYQGEITKKNEIQKNFLSLIEKGNTKNHDWEAMDQLLMRIIEA